MPNPRPLEVIPFGLGDPLHGLGDRRQTLYLRRYLEDLGAATVVAEPYYFDRDYLAEFAAFYCVSSAGYPNGLAACISFSPCSTPGDGAGGPAR